MCYADYCPKRRTNSKTSIGNGDDKDHTIADAAASSSESNSPLQSQHSSHARSNKDKANGLSKETMMATPPPPTDSAVMHNAHNNNNTTNNHNNHNNTDNYNRTRRNEAGTTIETILPNVVWLEHILPCLDRPSWNSLTEASKSIYVLTMITKLSTSAFGGSSSSPPIAQPPWPTNRSFQSKSGGQGQAIESIAISRDGEFLACGSVIGSIDIWNLRTGKLQWKTPTPTTMNQRTVNDTTLYETAEELAQYPNYFQRSGDSQSASPPQASSSLQRRTTPLGNVLRFSPEGGYTLACGFENRVFVWDLEQEIRRRNQLHQQRNKRCKNSNSIHLQQHQHHPLSYAFPPQPQLRDDRREVEDQEMRRQILQEQKKDKNEEFDDSNSLSCYQILEIECNQGTIYEVTYLGFSSTFGSNNNNNSHSTPHRLIARYGKTAYIWTATEMQQDASIQRQSEVATVLRYIPTHSISLTSSRCQMVSNPALTMLAVATNGGGRRNRGNNNDDGSYTTNKITSEGKGIIHVWDLEDSFDEQTQSQPCSQQHLSKISSNCNTKIVAYPNHVVRGLEFLQLGGSNTSSTSTSTISSTVTSNTTSRIRSSTSASDCDSCLLVSASLQGEVKFWKKHAPSPKLPRDRYNSNSNTAVTNINTNGTANKTENRKTLDEREEPPGFVCVYRFQSPGKIFSLASWSSGPDKILLAAGEARGQVRVWKVSPSSFSSSSCSSLSPKVSLGSCGKSKKGEKNSSKQQRLEECLSTEVGDHVHYDNIKLLAFTPNGKSLAVSRAYDAKIWFQSVWQ